MKIADKFVVPMDFTHFGWEFLSDMGDGLHLGVDLNWQKPWDDLGKQINATASGEVIYSKKSKEWNGAELIILKHLLPDNKIIYSRYAHLKDRWIAEGQEVECGQGIGACGNTGTKYPHLHWDMFIEKFIKDGNRPIAYPQKWDRQRLLNYFFDPLLFVKNFNQEIEEEDCKKELRKTKGELESIKKGIEEIAVKLNNLAGEHKVEATIPSISGEIDGWLEIEDKHQGLQDRYNSLVRQREEFLEKAVGSVGVVGKTEAGVLGALQELTELKKTQDEEKKVWERKIKELNALKDKKVEDYTTKKLIEVIINRIFRRR